LAPVITYEAAQQEEERAMVSTNEKAKKSAVEAAQWTQDAMRRYMDESTDIGRATMSLWLAATNSSIKAVMQQQTAAIKAVRMMADANAQANREWLDQAAETWRMAQDTTTKIVDASNEVIESMIPAARV
jgi:hypothetical protein